MAEKFISPIGELNWVFIDGDGKEDLNGNPRYSVAVHYHKDSDEFKKAEKAITKFWNENKPKGAKQKSNGIKTVNKKVEGQYDDNGDSLYEETDYRSLSFWTGISYPNGNPKVIKTFNARGSEVSLGDKKIGNGSTGAVSGAMAIYDQSAAARGVTLYLNAIQIKKFVAFSADSGFDDVGDDEDAFTGVTTEFESADVDDSPKPRL